jgi:hypothetical protein
MAAQSNRQRFHLPTVGASRGERARLLREAEAERDRETNEDTQAPYSGAH